MFSDLRTMILEDVQDWGRFLRFQSCWGISHRNEKTRYTIHHFILVGFLSNKNGERRAKNKFSSLRSRLSELQASCADSFVLRLRTAEYLILHLQGVAKLNWLHLIFIEKRMVIQLEPPMLFCFIFFHLVSVPSSKVISLAHLQIRNFNWMVVRRRRLRKIVSVQMLRKVIGS